MKTVAVLVLVAAAILDVAAGHSDAQQYLDAHNSARQEVGAGIPDLSWHDQLADFARDWASNRATQAQCKMSHSDAPYGENIYWSGGSSTPADAVALWVKEKQYYNYDTNSCAEGEVCGHYTQVIWRNTQFLGCGSASCPGGGTFVVCSYYPPGNYNDQKPYLQSSLTTEAVEGGLEEA